MKIAYITMVWQDYWFLERWVAHVERAVPRRQIYIINHGGDPRVDALAEGCNILQVPREELTVDLTERRWTLIGNLARGLLGFYDRVISLDVDEFLVSTDPARSVTEQITAAGTDTVALAPIGLNCIPVPLEGAEAGPAVLDRYPQALISTNYTKPCIINAPVDYTPGGHGIYDHSFDVTSRIALLHLHFVAPDYLERMAARRDIVLQAKRENAESDDPIEIGQRHWINWEKPERNLQKTIRNFEAAQLMDLMSELDGIAGMLRAHVTRRGRKYVLPSGAFGDAQRRVVIPEALRVAT